MFCTHCGQQSDPDTKFCSFCGRPTPTQAASFGATTPIPSSVDPPAAAAPVTVPLPTTAADGGMFSHVPTANAKRAPAASAAAPRMHSWLAAAQPTPAQLSADASNLALALALQLLCCLGITFAVSLLLPDGHHGSIVDWLRGMVVLGGASQRGAVTADLSASVLSMSGQVSAFMTAPPLLLTALVVALLAVLVRRSERENPSQVWQVALGRTLITAAIYALTWALLGVLASGQLGFGSAGDNVTAGVAVGMSFWSLLGHGLLMAALVGGAVRLLPQVRSHSSWWERLADTRHAVAATATLTVLTWAAVVVVAIGWVIYTTATSEQSFSQGLSAPVENIPGGQVKAGVAALLVMAAMAANIVMVGGALLLGNAVGYSGDDRGLFQTSAGLQSQSVGIFLGDFSSWWYVAPLVLWFAAVLLGVRVGGRFNLVSRGGRALAHYVGAAVLTSLAVAALTRFALNISVTGSVAGSTGSAGYSGALGIGWKSSFLIGVIIGLLIWSGHRFLLPELAAAYPRQLAGALGRRMHPAWALALADATVRSGQTPQPWLVQMADAAAHLQVRPIQLGRRRLMLLGSGLGVFVMLAAGVAIGHHWLSTSVYGPESTVRTFADAQIRADSSAALGTLSDPPKSSTVGSAALKHQIAQHPITDVSVKVLDVQDDSATVRMVYRQDGKAVKRTLTLGAQANSAQLLGLYPKWLIVDGALTEITVETESSQGDLGEIKILGQSVDPTAGPFPVFPGPVDVTAAGTNTVQSVERTLDLTGEDQAPVATLPVTLRPDAAAAAATAVRDSLKECVAQKTLAPVGCPFYTSSYGDAPLNVRWSMTSEPQVEVTLDDTGQMRAEGTVELRVSYVQPSEFGAAQYDESVTADLSGSAFYDGKIASVTYDNGNSTQGTD